MTRKKTTEEMCQCPMGAFFRDVEKVIGKKSGFRDHMTRSRIEVLKAIRSLVDERIEGLDKKKAKADSRKVKNIRVE